MSRDQFLVRSWCLNPCRGGTIIFSRPTPCNPSPIPGHAEGSKQLHHFPSPEKQDLKTGLVYGALIHWMLSAGFHNLWARTGKRCHPAAVLPGTRRPDESRRKGAGLAEVGKSSPRPVDSPSGAVDLIYFVLFLLLPNFLPVQGINNHQRVFSEKCYGRLPHTSVERTRHSSFLLTSKFEYVVEQTFGKFKKIKLTGKKKNKIV